MSFDELKRLAAAATPGPWTAGPFGVSSASESFVPATQDDARYMAAVPPDVVLALLDEIERLRAALAHIAEGER